MQVQRISGTAQTISGVVGPERSFMADAARVCFEPFVDIGPLSHSNRMIGRVGGSADGLFTIQRE